MVSNCLTSSTRLLISSVASSSESFVPSKIVPAIEDFLNSFTVSLPFSASCKSFSFSSVAFLSASLFPVVSRVSHIFWKGLIDFFCSFSRFFVKASVRTSIDVVALYPFWVNWSNSFFVTRLFCDHSSIVCCELFPLFVE